MTYATGPESEEAAPVQRAEGLAGLVAAQTDQVARLAGHTQELTEQVAAESRARRRDRKVYITLILTLVLMVAAVGTGSYFNRQSISVIRDCTQPTGKCFKDSQDRLSHTVQNLNAENKRQHDELLQRIDEIARETVAQFCTANPTQCAP